MNGGYDDQNIFAKILRGEIPSHKVYEDEHNIGIMDVMPRGKGHVLVLPKGPSRNILDIGAHDLEHLILAVQQVARAVKKAFDADGVTIANYGEAAGGQSVFHTHFHIIPRFDGEPLKPRAGKMEDAEVLSDQAFKIRAVLGGQA